MSKNTPDPSLTLKEPIVSSTSKKAYSLSPEAPAGFFPESPELTSEDEDARPPQRRADATSCPEKTPVDASEKIDHSLIRPQIIFFGNGPLADYTLDVLKNSFDIVFHARTAADLDRVIELKKSNPNLYGILASFGVLIRENVLSLFEPEGILNLHPSLLPQYRGASPIESAILAGDADFSYSIMKLVKKMDAGPIYHQSTLTNLPLDKSEIYRSLATAGAEWLVQHLSEIRSLTPTPQDDTKATFTTKLTKDQSFLRPDKYPAKEIFRQIVAYQGFPKPKYQFFGKTCIILEAHPVETTAIVCDPSIASSVSTPLMIKCADRNFVAVDRLQPEGKKPMDAKSFINGYGKQR